MDAQHLGDLVAHGEDRVQRAHRLLEHHRNVFAAQMAHVFNRRSQQVFTVVQNFAAGRDDGVLRQQAHDAHRRHAFATAGFAHQGHRAVLGDVKAHTLHRLGGVRFAHAEGDAQILNAD